MLDSTLCCFRAAAHEEPSWVQTTLAFWDSWWGPGQPAFGKRVASRYAAHLYASLRKGDREAHEQLAMLGITLQASSGAPARRKKRFEQRRGAGAAGSKFLGIPQRKHCIKETVTLRTRPGTSTAITASTRGCCFALALGKATASAQPERLHCDF